MSFFKQSKPRRFHHEPIYYDEHHDRVNRIEERARKELGLEKDKKFNPEDIRGAFTGNVKRKLDHKRTGLFSVLSSNTGAILVIILVLLLVWIYLSR